MSKTIFLKDIDYLTEKIKESGVSVIPLFRRIFFLLKPVRIVHLNSNLPFKSIWYYSWKTELDNFDIIIVSASFFSVSVTKYIDRLKIKPSVRLVYWYWDPIRPDFTPARISDKWEKWSFDKQDCEKYKLKYNSTYYFESILLPPQQNKYDVFFIGQDKGRLIELIKLEETFSTLGLKTYFHIVADNKTKPKKEHKRRVPYTQVLTFLSESSTIVELLQKDQSGLTLRCMEALFFNKKLITSNVYITRYNFYKKENIFILGVDDLSKIKSFIEAPYVGLDPAIVKQYNFNEWMYRLKNNIILRDEP